MRRSAIGWVLRAEARYRVPRGLPGEHRVKLAARTLGLPPLDPRVWLTEAQREDAARLLPGDGPTLALGIGATWICKTWPADRFAALALALTRPGGALAGGRVLLVGAPEERAAAGPLFDALPRHAIVDGFGLGIPTAAALLQRSSLFVGNDSGMMHLAAAAGVRTVGLFGPTPEDLYGPWGAQSLVVRTAEPLDALLTRIGAPGSERTLMEGLAVDGVVRAIARRWPGLPAHNA
jgi:ADP-heptose:LPS heptosyltransferase